MTTPPSTLPHYPTALIGRNATTGRLAALLRDPAVRLVTMVGASGAGKTRLSLQVAEELADIFDGERYFVALAPVTNPVFVLPTIAQALGVKETGSQPLLESLGQRLGGKPSLLLLDNFEQVRAAAPQIEALLGQAPGVKMLVTSQIALGAGAETLFEVPPLAYPDNAFQLSVPELLGYSAVALFVDRLRAVQPRFELTAVHAQAIVEICQLVNGLPLAIELIAAHSALLSPADLLVFVRNHLALGGRGQQAGRQRILYPVLDWCYSRLSAEQQTLFGRLGIFAGGCDADAIESIYRARGDDADVAGGLATLRDKHLVLEETLPGQSPHLIMLDAIREYAHQRLHKRKEYAEVAQSHSDYYLAWSDESREGLKGLEQQRWYERFQSEIHNLRAVLQRLLEGRRGAQALQLATNLAMFWYRLGYLQEGRRWLGQALGLRDQAEHLAAGALHSLGLLTFAQGEYAEAKRSYQAAFALRQAEGGQPLMATLNNLGLVATYEGAYAEAERYYREALELTADPAMAYQRMMALANLGFVLICAGDAERADPVIGEALRLCAERQDTFGLALLGKNQGEIALLRGDLAEAARLAEDSLAGLRRLNNRGAMNLALNLLALARLELGELARARELLLECAELQRELGSATGLMEVAELGAYLLEAAGEPAPAAGLAAAARRWRADTNTPAPAYLRQRNEALDQRLAAGNLAAEPLDAEAAIAAIAALRVGERA